MPVVKRTLNFYWSQLTNGTHYLNKATTTIISTSNIFIMVGYNCFINLQCYYLKSYENFEFFFKIWNLKKKIFGNFMKFLKFTL